MALTLLEQFVAQLNSNVFFREFAFPSAHLRVPGGEVELADHLVLLDEIGLIFQLKERSEGASASTEALSAWFDAKVRRKGVSQISATKRMLVEHAGKAIPNDRGELVILPATPPSQVAAVVVYAAPRPAGLHTPRFHVSRTAGFVHFIEADDYLSVCQSLVTPTEVFEYLAFREHAVTALKFVPTYVPEAALVGQYMGGDPTELPNPRFARAFAALLEDRDEWDLSFLTSNLVNQIVFTEGSTAENSHHRILAELAKLARSDLRQLKVRFQRTLEAVEANECRLPYRFTCPRTGCGFLIFPVPTELKPKYRVAIHNYSVASKYEQSLEKHISIAVMKDGASIDIVWMLLAGPNDPNPEAEALLASSYPFRPLREEMMPRYRFDSDELRRALAP